MNLKLKTWFEMYLPELVDDLNGPATLQEIESAENLFRVKFSDEFRLLYLTHNGQKGDISCGVFYGLTFLSLEKMRDQWHSWAEIIDASESEDLVGYSESYVKGMVKEVGANKGWIPFAYDWAGNFLGLDYDPDTNGTAGQVINFGRDEEVKYVLGSTFSQFIDWYVGQLEEGNYLIQRIDSCGPEFHTRKPISEHFLDSLNVLFE